MGGIDEGVKVGNIGVGVNVGGTGVVAGAHALNKAVRKTNTRKIDPIDFFMTLSPFELIFQGIAQRFCVSGLRVGLENA